ncbi:hypothetical protein LJC56_07445 [Christensenellaceae bacterium OttesenSCG-928-K19]|nr:hypothetical protein [Christensenellaceae bacterium OttesenSCG-928-K19]
MQTKGMRIWSGINIALGAFSFVMFLDGAWFWIGFACAIAALILGTKGRKSPYKGKQACSMISIVLAVGAAVVFLALSFASGASMPVLL